MTNLGVNIDHVATVRNARGESHPDPYFIAKQAMNYGADSITIHLREDRRHIIENDLKIISSTKIPLNLEIAATYKMLKIVGQTSKRLFEKLKPDIVQIFIPSFKSWFIVVIHSYLDLKPLSNLVRTNWSPFDKIFNTWLRWGQLSWLKLTFSENM